MKRLLYIITGVLLAAALATTLACATWGTSPWLALSITFWTSSYHFVMRLLVGATVDRIFHNRMNYQRRWFQERPFEKDLYRRLRVRTWKKLLPTYTPEAFDITARSLEEIVMAGCQAEVVHELIVPLSFVPLAAIPAFGAPVVFILTSSLAALFDLALVVLQRFNRPRFLRLMRRQQAKGQAAARHA